eukprot:scaffold9778_cov111-Isochrysis_galbana.AAC.7
MTANSQHPQYPTPNTHTHIQRYSNTTYALRTAHYACPHPSTLILPFILLIAIGATLAIRQEVPPGPYGIDAWHASPLIESSAHTMWCKPSDWDLNLDPKRAWPRKTPVPRSPHGANGTHTA